jgi:ribonuclease D
MKYSHRVEPPQSINYCWPDKFNTSPKKNGIKMKIRELKNDKDIKEYIEGLDEKNINVIGLDIEGEFNLHCYGEHLCLVQIFDGIEPVIIDPFDFANLNPLKRLFEKKDLLKITYDSNSDSSLLLNVYGIHFKSILDLRPAVSLLDLPKQALSHVLTDTLGIAPINKKKYQMYNWMKRPINNDALHYAVSDVLHLFKLKQALFDQLLEKGLMDTYILQNMTLQNHVKLKNRNDRHLKAKGYKYLSNSQKEIFEKLFYIRDRFAKETNQPPNNLFNNKKLIELCKENGNVDSKIRDGISHRANKSVKSRAFDEMKSAFN